MKTIIITRKVDLQNLIKKINCKIIKCQVNVLINLKLEYGLILHFFDCFIKYEKNQNNWFKKR